MSVLEDLGKQAMTEIAGRVHLGAAPGGRPDCLQMVMGLLSRSGGLQELMSKFDQGGLGSLVGSWISTGANPPISAEQIKRVLGDDLSQLASEAGTDPQSAAVGIAQVLPGLIDQLTPNGEPVEGDALQQGLKELLGGNFSKILG